MNTHTSRLLKRHGWKKVLPKFPSRYERTPNNQTPQAIVGHQNGKWHFHPRAEIIHEAYPFRTLAQAVQYAAQCEVE